MKSRLLITVTVACLVLLAAGRALGGEFVATFTGIPNGNGHIWIALYNSSANWDHDMEAKDTFKACQCVVDKTRSGGDKVTVKFSGKIGAHPILIPAKKASGGSITVTFTGVKPGDYAISLFHDQDDSRKMNMKPMLLVAEAPAEPYGFSRNYNPMKKLRAPDFRECSFTVGEGSMTQEIRLR